MADGSVDIEVSLEDKKAKSQASKVGKQLGDAVKDGAKTADKALDDVSSKFGKAFKDGGSSAKDSMRGVGDSANEMGEKVEDATDKGSSGFVSLAKKAAAALVAIGAITKAAEFVKSSLDAYASYEQLVGGVETLFGAGGKSAEEYAASVGKSVSEIADEYAQLESAQNTVLQNAANAYKTAGVSANTYMEQATSFSASLVSSLGGDTVAAAKYADQAIIDMSDNANKMGTSIDRIQDAYQGFAKQNYTMLDNLKLGYGGTKTEMERLIADANAIAEANGQAADLSIDSFADVVEAIHIVQDNMGITGTTALEAATTIEGSINMAKAAYENWLVGLADDNANIAELSEQLAESIGTAAENILPRLATIVNTLARTLLNILPGLVANLGQQAGGMVMELVTSIVAAIPTLAAAGIKLVGQFATAILGALPQAIADIVATLPESIPLLIDAVMEMVTGLVEALPDIVQALVAAMPTIVDALVTGLINSMEALINGFIQLFMAFIDAIPQIIAIIVPMMPTIVENMANALIQNLPRLMSAAVQLFTGFISGIVQSIPSIVSKVGEVGSRILSTIGSIPGRMLEVGKNIIQGLWDGIAGSVDWLIGKIQGFCSDALGAIKGFFGIASPSKVMRDVVGRMLPRGIVVGWEQEDLGEQLTRMLEKDLSSLDDVAKSYSIDLGTVTAESISLGFDQNNPMSQIADTVMSGLDAISMMVQTAGNTVNNNSQVLNFNQPVSSPDQLARTMRMQQRYGLAGAHI